MTTLEVDWAKVGLWGPPPPRRRFGPRDVAYAVAWLVGVNIALAAAVLWWMSTEDPATISTDLTTHPAVLAGGLIALWVVFAGVPTLVTRRHGAGSLATDFGWRVPTAADWGLGAVVGLTMRAGDLALGALAGHLGWVTGDNSGWLFLPRPWLVTALFALGAAVVAPALEELFFRGLVLRAMSRATWSRPRWSTPVAIVVSSLLFGMLHTTAMNVSGLYVAGVTAAAGTVLALLAVRRKNLGAAITAHIVFNTTGVIGAWMVTL